MKVLVCGACGAMGRAVSAVLREYGHEPVAGIDKVAANVGFPVYGDISEVKEQFDCIIDFSHPSLLKSIIDCAVEKKTPAVIATTGISDEQIEYMRAASASVPIFFSFNMSFGVNVLASLAKKATAALYDAFDIELVEMHHNRKLDAPSGTAILLADAIADSLPEPPVFVYDRHSRRQKRDKKEIGISSVRGGTIVGEHEIIFAGKDEMLTLKHTALSRDVFAVGAVKAAQFLAAKESGLYSMSDMIGE
ncbi:MAG: 4-hydroxy-tetrahydrodipicolinate reductase [Clostridia bacterium]|nr:4-hydroxy-tetrahydrodipicolinate reductase [Clostridia bacterium]